MEDIAEFYPQNLYEQSEIAVQRSEEISLWK